MVDDLPELAGLHRGINFFFKGRYFLDPPCPRCPTRSGNQLDSRNEFRRRFSFSKRRSASFNAFYPPWVSDRCKYPLLLSPGRIFNPGHRWLADRASSRSAGKNPFRIDHTHGKQSAINPIFSTPNPLISDICFNIFSITSFL